MTMSDYREIAAGMDMRMRQLATEGVPVPAVIARMVSYLPDLQKLWTSTTDEQLAMLCREYPGFYRYATLMEEAARIEAQKTTRPYDNLPELSDPLKRQLTELLGNAASLERSYQSVLEMTNPSGSRRQIVDLIERHRHWTSDLTRFKAALHPSGVPQTARDLLVSTLGGVAKRIAELEARAQQL